MENWFEIAKSYVNAGLSVIPTSERKSPIVDWKIYQSRLPTHDELGKWDNMHPYGIGVVTGAVSGNLVCFDMDLKNLEPDQREQFENDFETALRDANINAVNSLITVETMSGGLHYIARHKEGPSRSGKALAKSPTGKVIFETREEGHFIQSAPTDCYNPIMGTMTEIPEISEETYFTILSIISAMNQKIDEPVRHEQQKSTNRGEKGVSPLDDYDNRATEADIIGLLTVAGWKLLRRVRDSLQFQRPGKNDRMLSATWNHIPGRFYCFTSSTDFEPCKAYKPCGVYAVLNHGGDFKATAKALVNHGFGERNYYQKDAAMSPPIPLVSLNGLYERLLKIKKEGFPQPFKTGLDFLDGMYATYPGQLNLISGVPGSGKSEFLEQEAFSMAKLHNIKWLYFTPESNPFNYLLGRLVEKITGKSFILNTRNTIISDSELKYCAEFIDKYFAFPEASEEKITLNTICDAVLKSGCNGLLIDPWNELESQRPPHQNESEYIGESLRILKKFIQKNNTFCFIVAHPAKLKRNKDGGYDSMSMYDLAGSAHWYNKTDNCVLLHRDKTKDFTNLQIAKIKNKNCGTITQDNNDIVLFFDVKKGKFEKYDKEKAKKNKNFLDGAVKNEAP